MTGKLYDYQQTSLYAQHIRAKLDDTPLAGTRSIVILPFLDVSQTSILKTSPHLAEATSLAGRISIATSPSWVAAVTFRSIAPLALRRTLAFAPLAGKISVATSSSHMASQRPDAVTQILTRIATRGRGAYTVGNRNSLTKGTLIQTSSSTRAYSVSSNPWWPKFRDGRDPWPEH
ncbi:hypothetical protein D9611_005334 [Ephemerocybe angulata]|uniref:Uncharacterized protein n=1 Tax=Ephemerocybe angulata TaxID=980116 RepID=A0A8H5FDG2_9AGAR|nr:hypothetical protein D9611_005334 [Tulosesus angulatus]